MEAVDVSNIITEPVETAVCPKCGKTVVVRNLQAFSDVRCPGCGNEFPVPAKFGPFLLLELLGAGGMGGVFRARDLGLNREIAVKVMLKSLGDDPQFVETFRREAQAAAKLNHPNIVQIYSFDQEKGQPYIAMELVAGGSLDKMMERQGPLSPTMAVQIGMQIAKGLSEAADAGLVHGDVKPENILFDADKNAKLADFGLAAMSGGPDAEVWGTPYYIAPEKVRKQKSDYRADIYSLGGTLYHAIAGVPPFEGEDASAVVKARFDGPPRPLSELRPDVKPDVVALIGRMLEMDPGARYPTYGSLLGDMKRYLSSVKPVNMKKASRRIVIKGRAAAVRAAGGGGPEHSAGGRKILVGGRHPEAAGPAGGRPGTPGSYTDRLMQSAEPVSRGKRGCRTAALIGLAVLALGGIVGGIIYGAYVGSGAKKAKSELIRIRGDHARLLPAFRKYGEQADGRVKQIEGFQKEAMGYAKKAEGCAAALLGDERRKELVPEEPSYADVTNAPAAAAADVTNAPAAAAAGTTNAPAAGTAGGTNAPAAAAAGELAGRPAAAAVQVSIQVEVECEDGGQSPEGRVVTAVRDIYQEAYAVKGACIFMKAMRDEIADLIDEAGKITLPEKPAPSILPALTAAESRLLTIKAELERAVHRVNENRSVQEAPNRAGRLKKKLDSLKVEVSSLLAVKRQKELEEEKRAREEALAKQRAEEARIHREKAAADRGKVDRREIENIERLKSLDFRAARREMKALGDDLETNEGRDAMKTALDRVDRIEQFHEFILRNAKGFNSARVKIESADNRVLVVNGRKISWMELYTRQMAMVNTLIRGLVVVPRGDAKEMTLRERTKTMTNAALFLTYFYREVPSAQGFAKALANKAAEEFPPDADTIKKLLPGSFE